MEATLCQPLITERLRSHHPDSWKLIFVGIWILRVLTQIDTDVTPTGFKIIEGTFFLQRCRPYGATATFLGSVQPFRMLYPRSALIHYALSVFENQASRPGGRVYRRGSRDSEIPPTGELNASTFLGIFTAKYTITHRSKDWRGYKPRQRYILGNVRIPLRLKPSYLRALFSLILRFQRLRLYSTYIHLVWKRKCCYIVG